MALKTGNFEYLTEEFSEALNAILNYWKKNTIDTVHGGFIGRISGNEQKVWKAEKGSVVNSRILWSFSAAYNYTGNENWLVVAHRSFDYIKNHFIDHNYGGVYWTVNYLGAPLNTKKQIYAIAFAIYGLSEYHKASGKEEALSLAKALYYDVEKYAYDPVHGGYYEAFGRNWGMTDDIRLSEKDANENKTTNTHLHILEAYTNLYHVWPSAELKSKIAGILNIFTRYIIDKKGFMNLFFDENWRLKSKKVSYGHDIEASWLVYEAARAVDDQSMTSKVKQLSIKMVKAVIKEMDENGGLNYELDQDMNQLNTEKHWWVQAEAMVGFFNAWQISDKKLFFELFFKVWEFTKKNIIDHKHGEWFWGIEQNGNLMLNEDKAGLWKCPYHNSRACIELMKRLKGKFEIKR